MTAASLEPQPLWQRLALAVSTCVALLLAGCSSLPYTLENDVQTFSGLSTVPTGSYRFERLPSQQVDPAQSRVEAQAEGALARAGLRRDDSRAVYSVQAWARVQRMANPWRDPGRLSGWGGLGWGRGYHSVGIGIGFPLWGPGEVPWYQREVGLVMREIATGHVVYESYASNDGHWLEPQVVTSAMFDAALAGFPAPAAGPRRVTLQIRP